MILPGDIVVISGIMAAGKSTVAQALSERLPSSVHLRGDLFRRMIVNGQAAVTPENWAEAERQLHLRYRLATDAASTYARSGFTVVYQDVIIGDAVTRVCDLLANAPGSVFLVVLAPDPAVAASRDTARDKTGYIDWTPADLDRALRTETPRIGLWLDTSTLTVDQPVDEIVDRIAEARLDVPYE